MTLGVLKTSIMKQTRPIILLLLITAVFAACSGATDPVEVTRIITQDVPVTVEVTRLIPPPVTVAQEIEVEVTRLVEVVVTATPAQVAETEPEPTATTAAPIEDNYYTIQTGDTLSTIAQKTGVPVDEIVAANSISNANALVIGTELLIPNWTGEIAVIDQPAPVTPSEPAAPADPVPAVPVGINILPNGSFEEDWYFFQGVSEWQLPNGWSMSADEGTNPLGSGGRYFRPEIRLLSRPDLPPNEQGLFVLEGFKTIKAFKGDAPTSFAIFRDVALEAGSYRLSISYFPDSVLGYDGQNKVYNNDPLSAEARIIAGGGGTNWAGSAVGNRNTITYDFTLDTAQTIRLGGAFRSRFEQSNNGWFLDDWTLQRLE